MILPLSRRQRTKQRFEEISRQSEESARMVREGMLTNTTRTLGFEEDDEEAAVMIGWIGIG